MARVDALSTIGVGWLMLILVGVAFATWELCSYLHRPNKPAPRAHPPFSPTIGAYEMQLWMLLAESYRLIDNQMSSIESLEVRKGEISMDVTEATQWCERAAGHLYAIHLILFTPRLEEPHGNTAVPRNP